MRRDRWMNGWINRRCIADWNWLEAGLKATWSVANAWLIDRYAIGLQFQRREGERPVRTLHLRLKRHWNELNIQRRQRRRRHHSLTAAGPLLPSLLASLFFLVCLAFPSLSRRYSFSVPSLSLATSKLIEGGFHPRRRHWPPIAKETRSETNPIPSEPLQHQETNGNCHW